MRYFLVFLFLLLSNSAYSDDSKPLCNPNDYKDSIEKERCWKVLERSGSKADAATTAKNREQYEKGNNLCKSSKKFGAAGNSCNRFTECHDDYNECGNAVEKLLSTKEKKLDKIAKEKSENEDDIDSKTVKKSLEEIEQEFAEAVAAISKDISSTKNKANDLGVCKNMTPNQIAQRVAGGYSRANETKKKLEEELPKLEEKLAENAKEQQESISKITDEIQKNNAAIANNTVELESQLKANQIKFMAAKDQLDANFALQNTKINDLKNVASQLNYDLENKNDDVEEACDKEADDKTQAYRNRQRANRASGRNRTTLSGALGSANIGGADGEDSNIYKRYYSMCLSRRKASNLKAKAQRDALINKQKIINELNRAIIEAGKIQTQLKNLVESSKVENEILVKKITANSQQRQKTVELLGQRLNSQNIIFGKKQTAIADQIASKKMEQIENNADLEIFKKIKDVYNIPDSAKDSTADGQLEKALETITAASAFLNSSDSDDYFKNKQPKCSDPTPSGGGAATSGSGSSSGGGANAVDRANNSTGGP